MGVYSCLYAFPISNRQKQTLFLGAWTEGLSFQLLALAPWPGCPCPVTSTDNVEPGHSNYKIGPNWCKSDQIGDTDYQIWTCCPQLHHCIRSTFSMYWIIFSSTRHHSDNHQTTSLTCSSQSRPLHPGPHCGTPVAETTSSHGQTGKRQIKHFPPPHRERGTSCRLNWKEHNQHLPFTEDWKRSFSTVQTAPNNTI